VTTTATPAITQSPRSLRRFAWFVLAYNIAVIVWGSAVRATGSGGGCGDHWPLCNGTVALHHPAIATLIELSHRATSGIDLVCVLALAFWTAYAVPKRHLARAGIIAVLVFTFIEALLGALLVKLGLVANNQSPARVVYLGLHLTNTLLLLAALALTAHFLSRREATQRGTVILHAPAVALTGLIATIIVGVTGSLAALADTLYPARNLAAALAQDFSSGSSWLLRLRWFHPVASLIAGLFILWLVIRTVQRSELASGRPVAFAVALLLAVQYFIGFADLALLTPTALQMAHILGADLLWIALIILAARTSIIPRPTSN
jgi:heme a synthase